MGPGALWIIAVLGVLLFDPFRRRIALEEPPGLWIAQPLRERKRAAPRLMTAALSQAGRTRKVRAIPRFYAKLCPA